MRKWIDKVVIALFLLMIGFSLGFIVLNNYLSKVLCKEKKLNSKHLQLYVLTIKWFQNYLEGKKVEDYLTEKGYKKIAVYGVSYIGETLIKELEGTEIEISYLIDNSKSHLSNKYCVYKSTDELQSVDAIIVTPITYYAQIKEELLKKVDCPIISFEEVIK